MSDSFDVELAVDQIVADLVDRRGLGQAWYEIDEDIQNEIKREWCEIIQFCTPLGEPK